MFGDQRAEYLKRKMMHNGVFIIRRITRKTIDGRGTDAICLELQCIEDAAKFTVDIPPDQSIIIPDDLDENNRRVKTTISKDELNQEYL